MEDNLVRYFRATESVKGTRPCDLEIQKTDSLLDPDWIWKGKGSDIGSGLQGFGPFDQQGSPFIGKQCVPSG